MQRLAQPEVVRNASLAALVTTLAAYPRLALWVTRLYALEILCLAMLLTSFVLWAFVFAWYPVYAQRQVFRRPERPGDWGLTTLLGLAGALVLQLGVDPVLRGSSPEDYPTTVMSWVAVLLFTLAFAQLFLCLAPFAFFLRLLRQPAWAMGATVLVGVVLLLLQLQRVPVSLSPAFIGFLLIVRVIFGVVSVWLFYRGGVGLVWWWTVCLHGRLLLSLHG